MDEAKRNDHKESKLIQLKILKFLLCHIIFKQKFLLGMFRH